MRKTLVAGLVFGALFIWGASAEGTLTLNDLDRLIDRNYCVGCISQGIMSYTVDSGALREAGLPLSGSLLTSERGDLLRNNAGNFLVRQSFEYKDYFFMFVGSTANNRTVLSDVLVIQKETQDEWLAIGPSRVDGKDSNHYWLIVTETDWTAETDEVRAVFFANPATMRIEELEFTSATFFSEI